MRAERSHRGRVGHARARADVGGFTLIELMITVAIIALLAAIAIPSYMDSVWKGKRAEGKAAILKMLQAEERYYTTNNRYVDPSTLAAADRGAFPAYSADSSATSRYTLSVTTTVSTGMCADNDLQKCAIVVATVIGSADPKCGMTLSMDTVGNRSSSTGNALCWK